MHEFTKEEMAFIQYKSANPYAEIDHLKRTGTLSNTPVSLDDEPEDYRIGDYIECESVDGLSKFLGQIVQVRSFEIIILCVKAGNRFDDPIEVNSVHNISPEVVQGILGDEYTFKRLTPSWV